MKFYLIICELSADTESDEEAFERRRRGLKYIRCEKGGLRLSMMMRNRKMHSCIKVCMRLDNEAKQQLFLPQI